MGDIQFRLSPNIPIMIKKELTVEFCVRGHHLYQSKQETKVDSELKSCHKTRPGAFAKDKYPMALEHKDVTVEHVPNVTLNMVEIFW